MVLSRAVRGVATAVLGGAAAVVLLPDVLRLDGRFPWIVTVAWRPQAVLGAALAASALGAWRPTRGAGVVLGTVAAAGAAAVAHRTPVRRAAAGPGEPVTVLSANVFTGRADTGR